MIKDIAFAEILQTGPSSKIRDLGRFGFSRMGVPSSGPADLEAFQWSNHLLRNNANDAQIEISQPGFRIRFTENTFLCLAGAQAYIYLNEREQNPFGLLQVAKGDVLKVGKITKGSILYLGILGGFQTEKVLGSRSMLRGITAKPSLQKGDSLNYFTQVRNLTESNFARAKWSKAYLAADTVSAYPGPEWDLLSPEIKDKLLQQTFHISEMKDSMAVQLQEMIPNQLPEILTAPVFPGTVQLTPAGKLLCLLQDAQVTGGYPRVLQIADAELRILAQKSPGQYFRFISK